MDIFGEEEAFVPGETDDDIRFGCLAFGFCVGRKPSRDEAAGFQDGEDAA